MIQLKEKVPARSKRFFLFSSSSSHKNLLVEEKRLATLFRVISVSEKLAERLAKKFIMPLVRRLIVTRFLSFTFADIN